MMLKFRKLYVGNPDAHDIDLPCHLSSIRCDLKAEIFDPRHVMQAIAASVVKTWMRDATSRRHLPLYTIEMSTSEALADKGSIQDALTSIISFQSNASDKTTPEVAVSPVAIFRGVKASNPQTFEGALIAAGLIQSLTINQAFDALDDSLTEIKMTVLDLRLETDFLQAVDVAKMNPRWSGGASDKGNSEGWSSGGKSF